jgi:hypothetical protein
LNDKGSGRGTAKRFSALAALALATALAACTGEKSFILPLVDADDPSGRYETVCAGWASRECAYTDACKPPVFAQWENDQQCLERETLACELQSSDPDVPFDPALVESCVPPAGCNMAPYGIAVASSAPDLCLPPGKGPDGAACVWDSACQSGNCSFASAAGGLPAACGTCQPRIRCRCAANQDCILLTSTDVKCVDLPDAGETCGAPLFLCNDAQCLRGASGDAGTCLAVPKGGVGAPCGSGPLDPQCLFSSATSLYCDHTNHCAAYTPADYGQPCTLATGGESGACVGGGWCDASGTGVCQPPAADGAPCDPDAAPCLAPARCLGGHCVFPSLATCSL